MDVRLTQQVGVVASAWLERLTDSDAIEATSAEHPIHSHLTDRPTGPPDSGTTNATNRRVVDATSGRGGCDVACDGTNRVGRDGRNQRRANYTFTSNGNEQRDQRNEPVQRTGVWLTQQWAWWAQRRT